MKASQVIGGITLVIPLIAALYGSMIYVTKLQNTLEQNTMAIELMTKEIANNNSNIHTALDNEIEKLDIRVKGVNELYKQGREEMLIEMTNFAKIIAEASPIPCVLPQTIAFLFFKSKFIYSVYLISLIKNFLLPIVIKVIGETSKRSPSK